MAKEPASGNGLRTYAMTIKLFEILVVVVLGFLDVVDLVADHARAAKTKLISAADTICEACGAILEYWPEAMLASLVWLLLMGG